MEQSPMRELITGNAQLCKMRYMIQQASATKHVLDKGASNMVAVCGELDELPPKNLLEERQQTRKGQIPATKVTVATTSMVIGMARPCSSVFRSTFFSAIARSTGHTMITTASAKAR
jgi:hypothetical protein